LRNRTTNNVIAVWPLPKLQERIFDMREYYHSRQSTDPFSDRPPWFRLVGRAFISLKSLYHETPMEHELKVVDENANVVGKLRVSIMPGQVVKNLSAEDLPPGMYEEREVDFSGYAPDDDDDGDDDDRDDEEEEMANARGATGDQRAMGKSDNLIDLGDDTGNDTGNESGIEADGDSLAGDAEVGANVDVAKTPEKPAASMTSAKLKARSRLDSRHGQRYRFVVTVLDASDLPLEFVDVFCQFRFLNNTDAAFSTESLQNENGRLQFYHAQQICVDITDRFLEYVDKEAMIFELFGHFESHPLHISSASEAEKAANLKDQISSMMSTPQDEPDASGPAPCEKHNLLVWYEICELANSGDFEPVEVTHDSKHVSYFNLQQGVQRRVRITISHESGEELEWGHVLDLSIGNIRSDVNDMEAQAIPALSLSILPTRTKINTGTGDDRTFLQIEANWDSAKHDMRLLNRVTPPTEVVFIGLSAVLDVKGCARPVVFKQDLALQILGREKRSSSGFFKTLMGPKIADTSKVSHVYDMSLKPASTGDARLAASPQTGMFGRIGEHSGYRPRGASLLGEHDILVNQHNKIKKVEQTKQFLQLHNALNVCAGDLAIKTPTKAEADVSWENESPERKAIAQKMLDLLSRPEIGSAPVSPVKEKAPGAPVTPEKEPEADPLIPELLRVDLTKNIIHKGYLLFLETRNNGWVKRWAFIRKPFLCITDHEKDYVIRVSIRLKDITIQFNEDHTHMMGVKNLFTMCTKNRGFLVQTLKPKDMETWLNHFDPLLAGTITSRMGLVQGTPQKATPKKSWKQGW